jgi:hypothetical protein
VDKPRSDRRTEERRRSERQLFSAIAEVLEPISRAAVSARIADLSLDGCYTDSLTIFPVGTKVALSIRHGGRHFEANATVVQAKTGMGMGLSFESLSDGMRSILSEWLSVSKGEIATSIESGNVQRSEDLKRPDRKLKLTLVSLIKLMMYKGQLTELEGRELLERLHQAR